jgi:filamentous hemagglutinin
MEVFRIIGIGVVGILDVDIFGITTNAIVCLNVNTHYMNVGANNLTLKTTKEDINITGSNIEAQQQLSLDSAKDINIQAGYDGSLNESYSKTSGLSLAGLVGIGSLYSSTEDLEGRIKRTAVNSTLSGNNITLNANNNIHVVGVDIQADNSISGNAKDINIPLWWFLK